jgi:hypothetical protein
MSETLHHVRLADLAALRLRCVNLSHGSACGAVLEIPIAQLATAFVNKPAPICPVCSANWGKYVELFADLGKKLEKLKRINDSVDVGFTLVAKE